MADAELVVGGHIPGAEARTAEGGADDRAGAEHTAEDAVVVERFLNGGAGRIDAQAEVVAADGAVIQNIRGGADVIEHTAGAARDHALVDLNGLAVDFTDKVWLHFGAELLDGGFLNAVQDVRGVVKEFMDGVSVARMERQRDHRLDLAQVDFDDGVIVSHVIRGDDCEVFRTAVIGVEMLHDVVGFPDGGKAGRLSRHDIDTRAEVHGKGLDAGAGEFEDLVLDETVFENRLDQVNSDVMRADTRAGRSGQVDEHDLRVRDVVGVVQKLFDQFRAAFADAHRAEAAVAGMAVGAEDHLAAAGKHFAGVLMNDGLMRGHEDAAVFLRGGKAEDVVVLVDRAADGAEAVVAVGQRVREREFLHAAGAGGLDDADVSDVMGDHRVEFNMKTLVVLPIIVTAHDLIRHCLFTPRGNFRRGHGFRGLLNAGAF